MKFFILNVLTKAGKIFTGVFTFLSLDTYIRGIKTKEGLELLLKTTSENFGYRWLTPFERNCKS